MDGSGTPARREEGFTLIEVVVSLGLIVLIMVAVLGFFVRSSGTVTSMQRRQAAVGLADQAVEVIRTVLPTATAADQSLLVRGRTATAVGAQWAAAPSFVTSSYLTGMSQASDPSGSSTPTVPFSTTQTVSGQPYTITQYIGTCWRPKAANSTCTTTNVLGSVRTYRVVVVLTWSPPEGQRCSTSPCHFALSSLVDWQDDPLFMLNGGSAWGAAPVANADSGKTNDGTALSINVKSNDTGTFGQDAVTVLTQPRNTLSVQGGTIAVKSGWHDGTLLYTPTSGRLGTYTFTYRISDEANPVRSSVGTGTLVVQGRPTAVSGSSVTVCVRRNSTKNQAVLSVAAGDPSTWSDHTLSKGTTSFPGTIAASSTYGTVTITATSATSNSGWSTPVTVTDSWGNSATQTLNIQVKTSC